MGMRRVRTETGIQRLAICLVVAAIASCSAETDSQMAVVGASAPHFTLPDLIGQPTSLSGCKGKVVLVDFWATWCPPCVEELPHIQRLHEEFASEGLAVLAVTLDHQKEKVRPFVERNGYTFPVLFNDGQIGSKYQVSGIPALYLVDRRGNVRYHHVGYSERSIQVIRQEIETLLGEDA